MIQGLSDIYMNGAAESRSITAENPRGEKGGGGKATVETSLHKPSAIAARDLGVGWKCSPCAMVKAGETFTLMDIDGPAVIRHMWFAVVREHIREYIVRFYWDGEETPSVEAPLGDFFCNAWGRPSNILALPINVNPSGGMNCFFPMPFRKHARITITNDTNEDNFVFYTFNYTLENVPEDALYFHAQWRRTNPVPYKQFYTVVDGIRGRGRYVGTFMAWQQNNTGWWGEGEILMYMDGDREHPTIIGTGTEDYFGGAWGFDSGGSHSESYSAPFMGYIDVPHDSRAGAVSKNMVAGSRSLLYRFHVYDPIWFQSDLTVKMQCIGWRNEGRYLPLQDDVSSVAYWYQTLPHAPFPAFPDRDYREIQ